MDKETRESLTNEVISRVLNNAPITEVLRVYSLSVQSGLESLSEGDLLESILKAGYTDILEKYSNLEQLVTGDYDEDVLTGNPVDEEGEEE
jgi:hypothetical protein